MPSTDIAVREAQTAAILTNAAGLIRAAYARGVQAAADIGAQLHLTKDRLPPGEFHAWIERELPFGVRAAQQFMHVYSNEALRDLALDPQHAALLPSDLTSLDALAGLPGEKIEYLLSEGKLRAPRGELMAAVRDAKGLRPAPAARPTRAELVETVEILSDPETMSATAEADAERVRTMYDPVELPSVADLKAELVRAETAVQRMRSWVGALAQITDAHPSPPEARAALTAMSVDDWAHWRDELMRIGRTIYGVIEEGM